MLDAEHLALLAHDLNNPLAAMVSNLGYALSYPHPDGSVNEALQDCKVSADVLKRLIDNLAYMAHRGATRKPAVADASVANVFARVLAHAKAQAALSDFLISVHREPGVERVAANERHLVLALENLVGTALAYAPSGSTVELVARAIDDSWAGLSVRDEGPEVLPEMSELMTDLAGQSKVKSAKGARYARAFGLHVASLVASDAGGTLSIERVGGKTVFELRLPRRDRGSVTS